MEKGWSKEWGRKRYISTDELERSSHCVMWGYVYLISAAVFFVIITYALVVSKLMPRTGNEVIDFIRDDYYYCCLIPFALPTSIFAVYANWACLKFFRHN